MLVSPQTSGVLRASDHLDVALQRGLVRAFDPLSLLTRALAQLLMTKVITNIANENQIFDKEEWMRPLSELIATYIPRVRRFYDQLLTTDFSVRSALLLHTHLCHSYPRRLSRLHRTNRSRHQPHRLHRKVGRRAPPTCEISYSTW